MSFLSREGSFFSRQSVVARSRYNRWLVPPAALAMHLSIGQVYAFSVFKTSLVAHFRTDLTMVAITFSIAIVVLGLAAAFSGTWIERRGPRVAMLTSAVCFSGGLLVGGAGVATNQLWLLYLGYGVIGGIGLGIGYISPVSTLIAWFPDRPGMATGLAIMGFGGGAMIAAPLSTSLLQRFDDGFDASAKGAVADGRALALTFVTLGLIYLAFMTFGALLIRVPPPPGAHRSGEHRASHGWGGAQVPVARAVHTRQFALVWVVLFCNVTAGIGILEQAAPMIQDFFRSNGVSPITAAEAGGFVGLLSLANMTGRIMWSSLSDGLGRRRTYMAYLGIGAALYATLALADLSSPLVFAALAVGIMSFYGGGFATVPAYLKDLFGAYQVGAIHGRLLTAWSAAGVAGPIIVNAIIERRGTPGQLTVAAYQPALLVMVGVLAVGFIANLLVRPVDPKHFVDPERDGTSSQPILGATTAAPTGRFS
ncbi:MAG: OFA family MFS transporter [Angustibacter sp.]